MLIRLKGIILNVTQGMLVDVEVEHRNGFPGFDLVGLPDKSVKESKERVSEAIKNSLIDLKMRRVVCNLAPADIPKNGSYLDLPIALGILLSSHFMHQYDFSSWAFFGELGFDGSVRKTKGALNLVLEAKEKNITSVVLPKENFQDVHFIEGISFFCVSNLKQAIDVVEGKATPQKSTYQFQPSSTKITVNFSQIKGQGIAKRAAEISASGFHNLLLIGSPGVGKSMIAKSMISIMPPVSFEEAVEITKIHSVNPSKSGFTEGLINARPFRHPHHSSSEISIVGGGSIPKPGEISLAHLGILFLDELPEFQKSVFEALREPLEDHQITISRSEYTQTFPSQFLFIGAMNPCPCGFYLHPQKSCTCSQKSIQRYLKKISGPILDRIDLQIQMTETKWTDIANQEETSENILNRVLKTREIQTQRFGNNRFNSFMTTDEIEMYCHLDHSSQILISKAIERFALSMRSYHKILKVSRTIADLDQSDTVKESHLLEALRYRSIEKLASM